MNIGWLAPSTEADAEQLQHSRSLISRFTILLLSVVLLASSLSETASKDSERALFAGAAGCLAYLVCSHFAVIGRRKALNAARQRAHERLYRYTNQNFARLITALDGPSLHSPSSPAYVRRAGPLRA